MVRKLIICLIFLTSSTFAATAAEDERACSIFSSWVRAVAMHKASGVPAKDVIYSLEQQSIVEEDLKPVLQEIIDWLYDPKNPPITSGADIDYITFGAFKECVRARAELRNDIT